MCHRLDTERASGPSEQCEIGGAGSLEAIDFQVARLGDI